MNETTATITTTDRIFTQGTQCAVIARKPHPRTGVEYARIAVGCVSTWVPVSALRL